MIDLCVLEIALPPSLPPRGLSRTQAAEYVGVSPSTFDKLVLDGRMPGPLSINSRKVWDVRAIERAFDCLSPNAETDGADDAWDNPEI